MRNFTFKGLFLAVVFIVLGSLSIQAADGLITKQITIKLDEAGTLPNKIGSTKKFQITNLKIIGEINGRDLQMIREMAGKDVRGNDTDGMLSVLDLSDAKIVEGGGYNINGFYYPTSNDKIGDNAFCDCSGLTSLTLPSGVTEIGNAAFEGCSGLTSLTLPSGVAKIGDYAFHGCSGLTSIYVYAEKLPNMGNDVFEGCDAKKNVLFTFQKELMMIIGFLNLVILRTS